MIPLADLIPPDRISCDTGYAFAPFALILILVTPLAYDVRRELPLNVVNMTKIVLLICICCVVFHHCAGILCSLLSKAIPI